MQEKSLKMISGIVKCPICGVGMFGNKCTKKKKDGTKYKDFITMVVNIGR